MATKVKKFLNFNIDSYINPYVPSNQFKRVPKSVSHWFGYRSGETKEPGTLIQAFFAFTGAFAGLLIVGAIYNYAPGITKFNPPILIASLGASAFLEYSAITTPLAQPRATFIGHGISACIGVAISKAFQGFDSWNEIQWVAAALACAIASFATFVTNTVHPPGGATAILACVEPTVINMGWWFVPVLLVGISVMMVVSLLNNNIARQYPTYWWSPQETGSALRKNKEEDEENGQDEKTDEEDRSDAQSENTLQQVNSHTIPTSKSHALYISSSHIVLPDDIAFSSEEAEVLRNLQARLQEYGH